MPKIGMKQVERESSVMNIRESGNPALFPENR